MPRTPEKARLTLPWALVMGTACLFMGVTIIASRKLAGRGGGPALSLSPAMAALAGSPFLVSGVGIPLAIWLKDRERRP